MSARQQGGRRRHCGTRAICRARFICAIGAVACGATAHATDTPDLGNPAPHKIVALSGRPAPGPLNTFGDLGLPLLNNSGHVAFSSTHYLGQGDYQAGTFFGAPNKLSLVGVTGDDAVGAGPNMKLRTSQPLSLADSGKVLFNGAFNNEPTTQTFNYGTWVAQAGSPPQLVNYQGQPAPGLPPGTVMQPASWITPRLAGDHAVFSSFYSGAPEGMGTNGLWTGQPGGSFSLVMRHRQPAPGLPANVVYRDAYNAQVNAAGQIMFTASLEDAANPATPHGSALYAGSPTSPQLVLATDQPAPGVIDGYVAYIENSRLAASGRLAFTAQLGGQTDQRAQGLVIYSAQAGVPSSLQIVARGGQQVPGFPQGVIFRGDQHLSYGVPVFMPPEINSAGQVAFIGSVGYPNDQPPPPDNAPTSPGAPMLPYFDQTENETIWLHTPGQGLKLIAREKTRAPGTPEGYEFRAYVPQSVAHDPVFAGLTMNGKGQVVFLGSYAQEAEGPFTRAIFGTDQAGNLGLIVSPGQNIDVGNGVIKTISHIDYLGGASSEEGQPFSFNDQGQFAYRAYFSDGSYGIVLTTVPEPTTAALLMTCAILLQSTKRRKRR